MPIREGYRGRAASLSTVPKAFLTAILVLAGVVGCSKEEIVTYRIPAEQSRRPAQAVPAQPAAGGPPVLHWNAPPEWKPGPPSQMRVASFVVPGSGEQGESAVSVVVTPDTPQLELQVINVFREGLDLPALTEVELDEGTVAVPIGPLSGRLFDMVEGDTADSAAPRRLIIAVLSAEGYNWYFRLAGESGEVDLAKEGFLSFLASVELSESAAPAMASPNTTSAPAVSSSVAGAGQGSGSELDWVVPEDWKEAPPTQMIRAKFMVTTGEGTAEVTVSVFPGDVGGLAANINRWRRQVGLAPLADEAAVQSTSPLDVDGLPAMLVDLEGVQAGRAVEMLGVSLPRKGQTWFFKMLGDKAVVAAQKTAFLEFLKSLRYHDV